MISGQQLETIGRLEHSPEATISVYLISAPGNRSVMLNQETTRVFIQQPADTDSLALFSHRVNSSLEHPFIHFPSKPVRWLSTRKLAVLEPCATAR